MKKIEAIDGPLDGMTWRIRSECYRFQQAYQWIDGTIGWVEYERVVVDGGSAYSDRGYELFVYKRDVDRHIHGSTNCPKLPDDPYCHRS